MIDLDYKRMSWDELVQVINKCREELWDRGTRNRFCIIHFKTRKILEEFPLKNRK